MWRAGRMRDDCGMRRLPAIAVLAVAAAVAPSARAQQPTLSFDRPCYGLGEPIEFSGSGYTPNGAVDLIFGANGRMGTGSATADAAGNLVGTTAVDDPGLFLNGNQNRVEVFATANDRTRIEADQQPPESQFGVGSFTFTRSVTGLQKRLVAGRNTKVDARGWASQAGRRLYVLFYKGRRLAASATVGRLDEPCGYLHRAVRVPRRLKAGRYTVVIGVERAARGDYYAEFKRVPVRR